VVKWTKDQQEAIDGRESNLLISAAAGSGKTAVLVERIINLITKDKIDINKLLIVTFTNAAAGEMRERIGNAISKELEKTDFKDKHLRRQIPLLNKASISTIHSFCIEVVRKYFHLINIDPNFRIGDITETNIMKGESLEEIFEEEYRRENEEFVGLVERFGGNREDIPLQEIVLTLYEFIQSQPYPQKWLKRKVLEFDLDMKSIYENSWYKEIINQINIGLSGAREMFLEAKDICNKPFGPIAYEEAANSDIGLVHELMEAFKIDLDYFYKILSSVSYKRLGRVSKDVDDNLKEEFKEIRQQGKDIVDDIRKNILNKSPKEFVENLKELYPCMAYLCDLVCDFEKLYKEKKNEKGIVDFNDLEHYALEILSNREVAKEYERRFEYIFVDEYQDSNIVQETILNFIKRQDNMFMVGDVKQSIYRFRLADPSLFIGKYENFSKDEDSLNKRIDLSKNFRSRKEVIDGINYIFKNIMSKVLGEIDYDEGAYLYEGFEKKPMEDSEIEVNLIDKKSSEEIIDEVEELEYTQIEAKVVAKRIKELLEKEIYDYKKEEYRKVQYNDMVILLRNTRNWAASYMEVLMEEGIPVYADTNSGYFETLEIDLFMNFLKVIDNKMQDIPLISVMKSPIGKFSVEELIKIRIENKSGTFFHAVNSYIGEKKDDLSEKCKAFISELDNWKKEAIYIPIDKFIDKLYIETNYYNYIGSIPRGIQRQANLRLLIDKAKQFESTTIKGLFNFIKYVDKLKNSSGDLGEAKSLGENDNVVRIMSIHKSKGLEFPVVFVGAMGKRFNLRDTNNPLLLHKDLGLGPKYVDPKMRIEMDTIAKIAMKNRIKRESLSEEMRVLYEALTRAKDKLILVGGINDLERTLKKWKKSQNVSNLLRAHSYMDWIGPLLVRHGDLESLRENMEVNIIEDESKWKVNLLSKKHVEIEEKNKEEQKKLLLEKMEEYEGKEASMNAIIGHKLDWVYSYKDESKIPSKLTVSEIKRVAIKGVEDIHIPTLVKKPKFMESKSAFTGAQRGVIIHSLMEYLDFKRVDSIEYIDRAIVEMKNKELLTKDEASVLDSNKIWNFFQSNIGKRTKGAKVIYKEVPFNLVMNPKDIIPNTTSEEDMLIQGIIDCYFEEDEGLVLLDYKSDYIKESNHEIIMKYKPQLDLYEKALEKILNKRVKEKIIYSFYLDEEIRIG
jgi:ATP-dependent helicase/nuclease subunit A